MFKNFEHWFLTFLLHLLAFERKVTCNSTSLYCRLDACPRGQRYHVARCSLSQALSISQKVDYSHITL